MTIKDILEAIERSKNSRRGPGITLGMSFSQLVTSKLREYGWTQKQLADKCQKHESYISRVLNGDQNWSRDTAGEILFALNTTADVVENVPESDWDWVVCASTTGTPITAQPTEWTYGKENFQQTRGESKTKINYRKEGTRIEPHTFERLQYQELLG